MKLSKRILASILLVLAFLVAAPSVFAAVFTVKHIQVQGLRRIDRSTVMSYIPVHIGEHFDTRKSASIIAALYKTGFFSDVRLLRRGNTLVVVVRERPTIGLVQLRGNKSLPNKRLWKVLRKWGLIEGEAYDSAKLNAIVQGLRQQYNQLGRYAATVTPTVKREPRNRVAIYLKVKEGPVAKVSRIKIVGNKAFSEDDLLDHFKLTTTGLFSFISHHDRYSEVQLEKDLLSLQQFYFDHGYLRFRILSKHVEVSPKRNRVTIVITISEGPVYHISGYKVSGKYGNNPEILKLITLHVGQTFSRSKIMKINKDIGNYFADKGYAFPNIRVDPKINDANDTVFLSFIIDPRSRVYVRRVNIAGNARTKDSVIRSQIRQMEGGMFNRTDLQESKRRLNNLGYVADVKMTTVPVPNQPGLIDVNYHVKEINAGRATVQGGFSDAEGFLYGAQVSEPNFMGSGKYVALKFMKSNFSSSYSFSYNNPFYTTYGMSRGFDVFYSHTTPDRLALGDYKMDSYGFNLRYGLPISEYNTLTYGIGYQHMAISVTNNILIAPSIRAFLNRYPSPYNQITLMAGFIHSTLDRARLPQKGSQQAINISVAPPVLSSTAAYYQGTYDAKWYVPLGKGFIFNPHARVGYGNGLGRVNELPFFYNFYMGGIDTLPGYKPNSMGPQNPYDASAIGGNFEILGGVNMIFPNGLSDDLRTAVFIDFGNVFQTEQRATVPPTNYESVSFANLRVTTGLLVVWFVPKLNWPIEFSIGVPLNKKVGDKTSLFNFSIGAAL